MTLYLKDKMILKDRRFDVVVFDRFLDFKWCKAPFSNK